MTLPDVYSYFFPVSDLLIKQEKGGKKVLLLRMYLGEPMASEISAEVYPFLD